MARIFFCFAALTLFLPRTSAADPLNESLELGTSVSSSQDARNVLMNPAALGFHDALNGSGLSTAFSYGVNRNHTDEFSTALSLGYLGFGFESLYSPASRFKRFHFGLGMPVLHWLYLGTRMTLHRPSMGGGSYTSFDIGAQFRPSPYFSTGLLVNRVNEPSVPGGTLFGQYVLGLTVRPVQQLDLSVDIDTSSLRFGKQIGYQAMVGVTPYEGFTIRAGYHKDYEWQFGLQWNIANVAAHSTMQPSSESKYWVSGFRAVPLPYKSPITKISALKIEVDSSLSHEGAPGGLLASARPSLSDVLSKLEDARQKKIPRVILKLESFPLGLASAQEIHEAIVRLREQGTRVEVCLGNAGLKEYLVASAANYVAIEKSASLTIVGIRAESYFLHGTLDKLGVEGEFLARGEYKSAPEMFTRKESSSLNRQAVLAELKEAESLVLRLLARYRKVTPQKWAKILEHAVWSADEALEEGLVDAVEPASVIVERVDQNYVIHESLKSQEDRLNLPSRIAVIQANGDILQERMKVLEFGGRRAVTPERVEKHFERALGDPRTKAIVLRINSGGGEILASEEIATIVSRAKAKKPVIVSMGDAAASGGYFIAAPGNRIFADTLTITGSIGVFLGKFSAAGAYHWLKLNKEILSHAPYPGLYTEHRPWTTAERAILQRRLDSFYEGFVGYVAKERKLTLVDAENAAKGRVWLGSSAKRLKLVDEHGGLLDSIQYAAMTSGLQPGDFETWAIADDPGLLGLVGPSWWMKNDAPDVAALVTGSLPEGLARQARWMTREATSPYLYLSPIESFLP